MLTDELSIYLFDGKSHLLAEPVKTWLGSSRRFTSFVSTFREKIRKKLRVTQDREALYDLRLELETAYLLLREKTLSVAYEPEQNKQVRSPDFAVMYTTSLTFMVEVTRLRTMPAMERGGPVENERLADAICSKLGQCSPQHRNVLIVDVGALLPAQAELQALMLRIQQRAQGEDAAFWARYGFRARADFLRGYQRLSEVLLREARLSGEKPFVTWVNPQAKQPLPGKVRTVLYRSHTGSVF